MRENARGHLDGPLFRGLAVMRYLLLLISLGVMAGTPAWHQAPALTIGTAVAMVLVSLALHRAYASPRGRRRIVFAADLGAGIGLTLLSCSAAGLSAPLTGVWAGTGALALAIGYGWLAGSLSAIAICVAILLCFGGGGVQLAGVLGAFVVGAGGLGLVVERMRVEAWEHERASATAAALRERDRLARIVHDGVLQVLALVEREGPSLGRRGEMLARHATEQDRRLRDLIRDSEVEGPGAGEAPPGMRDIARSLDRFSNARVTVSTPLEPVRMTAARADELDGVITEALSNVDKHAGSEARAWVLLEREGDEAIVSIRDNGVGTEERILTTGRRGTRLGVTNSILGRIDDLGGSATVRAAPGRGVEWEFRIPLGKDG